MQEYYKYSWGYNIWAYVKHRSIQNTVETNVCISCISGLIKYALLSSVNIMYFCISRPLKRVETDSCVFGF